MDNNQIHTTSDYDQFRLIESNREQSRGHVENIKRAFEEHGNLTRVQPILVNENMEIIDGQHRFIACRDLGQPIYYTIVPGLGIRDARSMNMLHKKWGPEDYARSYAVQGNTNYQKYLDLREDYGFAHDTTLLYCVGSHLKGVWKGFRTGDFILEDEQTTRDRLNKLADVGLHVPFVTDVRFARALLKVLGTEGYDHARMLHKLELHQALLERKGSIEDYLRMLETVYNFQMSAANHLRFY